MKKPYNLELFWLFAFFLCFMAVSLLLIDAIFTWLVVPIIGLILGFYSIRATHFSAKIFLVAFIIRLIVIAFIETLPESDFKILFVSARQLLNGDTSFINNLLVGTPYFQLWPYQIGMVAFEACLLSIWNSIYMLQLVNCLAGSLTVVLIYWIACEFADEKGARAAALLYCFLPFPATFVTVLTNQFVPTFLTALGFYFLVSSKGQLREKYRYCLAGVLLAVANVLRPESIIPVFATSLSLVLCIRKESWKRTVICLGALLLSYTMVKFLINEFFVFSGIAPEGLINPNPYYKFMVGMNSQTAGSWSESDYALAADPEACFLLLKERLQMPLHSFVYLMIEKVKKFWIGGELWWAFHHTIERGLPLFGLLSEAGACYELLVGINQCTTVIVYLLMLAGIIGWLRARQTEYKNLLLVNHVFVPLGVFLLVEVQSRYIHNTQVFTFVLAGTGITYLAQKCKRIRTKIRKCL